MKIAIVGAGPSGSTAALLLARQKHEVVFVDRDTFPRTKTCGSGLGPRCIEVLREIGMDRTLEPMAYEIKGARFAGPSGREAQLSGDKTGAWIISRSRFDNVMAQAAVKAGAKFEEGFKVQKALRDPSGRYRGISDGKREIEADLTLFCDGAHSRFSEDTRPKMQIATIMGWWQGVEHKPNQVEMWFAPQVLPWYGWLFPEGGGRVNIGICYSPDEPRDPKEILNEVIERHVGPRIKRAEQVACECSTIVKLRGAPIVYTDSVGKIAAPGALWLGEAARLTHAATGEGIFQAMKSAQIASSTIARNLNGSLGSEYEKAIRRYYGPRQKIALGFLRLTTTPAFSWVTEMLAYQPVEKALAWALAHV